MTLYVSDPFPEVYTWTANENRAVAGSIVLSLEEPLPLISPGTHDVLFVSR
jgi:hypothetical protein